MLYSDRSVRLDLDLVCECAKVTLTKQAFIPVRLKYQEENGEKQWNGEPHLVSGYWRRTLSAADPEKRWTGTTHLTSQLRLLVRYRSNRLNRLLKYIYLKFSKLFLHWLLFIVPSELKVKMNGNVNRSRCDDCITGVAVLVVNLSWSWSAVEGFLSD